MADPESFNNISYSGKSIAKNTTYNLLGYGIPLIVAILLIPPLIQGLGDEKFGILNLTCCVVITCANRCRNKFGMTRVILNLLPQAGTVKPFQDLIPPIC